jgi:hypothetical protein
MPTPVVTLRLEPPTREALEAAAKRNRLSVSELIRRAVSDYLGQDGGRSSDLERARKYLGKSSSA